MNIRKLDYDPPELPFKADFQTLSKYQDYSAELLRLALLLLGGYGVMLHEIVVPQSPVLVFFKVVPGGKLLLMAALFALCVSASGALAHRIFSTAGFELRIGYIRYREQIADRTRTGKERIESESRKETEYKKMLLQYCLARWAIRISAGALVVATIVTAFLIWSLWPT